MAMQGQTPLSMHASASAAEAKQGAAQAVPLVFLPSDTEPPLQDAALPVQKTVKRAKHAAALYDAELPRGLVQLEDGHNGSSAAAPVAAGVEGMQNAANQLQSRNTTSQQAVQQVLHAAF